VVERTKGKTKKKTKEKTNKNCAPPPRWKTWEGKGRFKWDLLADTRCSQAVLGFLSTTDACKEGSHPQLRKMRKVSRLSGNPGSREKWRRSGGKRPRSWVPDVRNSVMDSLSSP